VGWENGSLVAAVSGALTSGYGSAIEPWPGACCLRGECNTLWKMSESGDWERR